MQFLIENTLVHIGMKNTLKINKDNMKYSHALINWNKTSERKPELGSLIVTRNSSFNVIDIIEVKDTDNTKEEEVVVGYERTHIATYSITQPLVRHNFYTEWAYAHDIENYNRSIFRFIFGHICEVTKDIARRIDWFFSGHKTMLTVILLVYLGLSLLLKISLPVGITLEEEYAIANIKNEQLREAMNSCVRFNPYYTCYARFK